MPQAVTASPKMKTTAVATRYLPIASVRPRISEYVSRIVILNSVKCEENRLRSPPPCLCAVRQGSSRWRLRVEHPNVEYPGCLSSARLGDGNVGRS